MNELIDWVEKQATENLRFRLQDTENLSKEGNATLTILLTALAAGVAYSIKSFGSIETGQGVIWGAIAFSGYILVVSAILVYKCLKIAEIPPPTNEPDNLYQPKFSLDKLREVELKNIQSRINAAVERNAITATWLNRVRLMAIASPLVFVMALAFYLLLDRAG